MSEMQNLLVVDDDPGIRSQLKWGIDGFQIHTADNKADALKQLKKHQPAIVTLDLGLPPDADGVTEGLDILRQIIAAAPNTQVIVVSGSDALQNKPKALNSGAFGFLSKPVSLDELNQKISQAFLQYQSKNQ